MEKEKYIVIPVHTEVLVVTEDLFLANQEWDFAELPYFNRVRQRDQNDDVPFTAQSIGDEAFNSQHLQVQRGIHLHWQLPEPSTKGVVKDGEITFPAIPNRWLITRTLSGQVKQWVVESDYLHAPQKKMMGKAVAIPYPPAEEGIPYRYLGRTYPLAAWLQKEQYLAAPAEWNDPALPMEAMAMAVGQPEYFKHSRLFPEEPDKHKGLTVMGYGNERFTTFYPNCHSVLGFYDGELDEEKLSGVRYEVLGWYANKEEDPMRVFLTGAQIRVQRNEWKAGDWKKHFELHQGLDWPTQDPETQGMLAYSVVEFAATPDLNLDLSVGPLSISVGVSGEETLAARMAEKVLRQRTPGAALDKGQLREWEKRMEALLHMPQLRTITQDIEAQFQQIKHQNEFQSVFGGTAWKIGKANSEKANVLGSEKEADLAPLGIPKPIQQQLTDLNSLQQTTDRVAFEVEEMEKQVFADWYKYVQAIYPTDPVHMVYPDLEMVRYFIREASARPLQARQDRLRTLKAQLTVELEKLARELALYNWETQERNINRPLLELSPLAQAPYYAANEPIVIVEGEAAGRKGNRMESPHCITLEVPKTANHWEWPQAVMAELQKLPAETKESMQFKPWQNQPWNPCFLEWEASFLPTQAKSNLATDNTQSAAAFHHYASDYLSYNYSAPLQHPKTELDKDLKDSPDWELREGMGRILPVQKSYSGRTFLTPVDHEQLMTKLRRVLKEQMQLPNDWEEWEPEQKSTFREQQTGPVPFYLEIEAALTESPILSQVLGGFNMGLLQRKPVHDLPIDDPVNFPLFRHFSLNLIASLVGNSRREAPIPLQYFHPWRAGCMRLRRLALLDSFGRVFQPDLDQMTMHLPTRLQVPGNPRLVKLVPRLAQPARLQWDWTLNHNGSPMIGWVMVNRLNQSLMIFEPDGEYAGQLADDGWHGEFPAPLDEFAGVGIVQPELRKWAINVVENALLSDHGWLGFFTQIATAARQISPESWANPTTSTLLGGRPLALARGALWLDVKGGTKLNQSWRAFEEDMLRFMDTPPEIRELDPERAYRERDRAAYDEVEVPVQLGASDHKGDGWVGIWQEFSPEGDEMEYLRAGTIQSQETRLIVAVTGNGNRVPLTILCDPIAELHWIAGILPVMVQSMPQEYWEQAIQKLQWESLPIPVLTPMQSLRLPLEHGPDTDWIWRHTDASGTLVQWETVGYIAEAKFHELATTAEWVMNPENGLSADLLWTAMVEAGWIRPKGNHWEWNSNNQGELPAFPACPIPAGQLESLVRGLAENAEHRIRPTQILGGWLLDGNEDSKAERYILMEGQIRLKPRKN